MEKAEMYIFKEMNKLERRKVNNKIKGWAREETDPYMVGKLYGFIVEGNEMPKNRNWDAIAARKLSVKYQKSLNDLIYYPKTKANIKKLADMVSTFRALDIRLRNEAKNIRTIGKLNPEYRLAAIKKFNEFQSMVA